MSPPRGPGTPAWLLTLPRDQQRISLVSSSASSLRKPSGLHGPPVRLGPPGVVSPLPRNIASSQVIGTGSPSIQGAGFTHSGSLLEFSCYSSY